MAGWATYDDLNTLTTRIKVPSNTWTKLTNDAASPDTITNFLPSQGQLWDTTNNAIILENLPVGTSVTVRVRLKINPTVNGTITQMRINLPNTNNNIERTMVAMQEGSNFDYDRTESFEFYVNEGDKSAGGIIEILSTSDVEIEMRDIFIRTVDPKGSTEISQWAYYEDLTTETTPIEVISGSWSQITCDGQGDGTLEYLSSIPQIWDTTNNVIVTSNLENKNVIVLRFDLEITTTVNSTSIDLRLNFGNSFFVPIRRSAVLNLGASLTYTTIEFFELFIGTDDVKTISPSIEIRSTFDTTVRTKGIFLRVV